MLKEIRDRIKGLQGAANNGRNNKIGSVVKKSRKESIKKWTAFLIMAVVLVGVIYKTAIPFALAKLDHAVAIIERPAPTLSRAQIESAINAYAAEKRIKVWEFRRGQIRKGYKLEPSKSLVLTIDSVINHKY